MLSHDTRRNSESFTIITRFDGITDTVITSANIKRVITGYVNVAGSFAQSVMCVHRFINLWDR